MEIGVTMNTSPILLSIIFSVSLVSCQDRADDTSDSSSATLVSSHAPADDSRFRDTPSVVQPTTQPATNRSDQMQKLTIMDRQYDMPANYVRTPAGYRVEGGVYWTQETGMTYAITDVRVFHPEKNVFVHFHPMRQFVYQEGPVYNQTAAYNPRPNVPPMSTTDAMRRFVFDRIQNNRGHVNFVDARPTRDRSIYGPAAAVEKFKELDGGVMILEYKLTGKTMKSKVYALQNSFTQRSRSMYGTDTYTRWWVFNIVEISAPASSFDRLESELVDIVRSVETNPEWTALARRIDRQKAAEIEQMTRNSARNHQARMRQNQANFEARQRAHRSTQDAYDRANASWRNNQAIQDAGHQDNVNAIWERETYTDPNTGTSYELDQPYDHNWIDNNGNVISTDDALYDPRIGSDPGQDHRRLEPK